MSFETTNWPVFCLQLYTLNRYTELPITAAIAITTCHFVKGLAKRLIASSPLQ